jgi:hypothetical protein
MPAWELVNVNPRRSNGRLVSAQIVRHGEVPGGPAIDILAAEPGMLRRLLEMANAAAPVDQSSLDDPASWSWLDKRAPLTSDADR